MNTRAEILISETTYHVYNRANGNELLFKSEENYRYFLQQYQKYILPIADTFCYCLMPNHFHFLLRIRSEKELKAYFGAAEADLRGFENNKTDLQGFENNKRDLQGFENNKTDLQGFENLEGLTSNLKNLEGLSRLITKQFSNFFNAYAKAFNKQHHRKGSLFMHPYKRIPVTDQHYLFKLVHYIHHNPVEAGVSSKPENWPHSSYSALIANNATFLKRNEVLNWFEDLDNFIYCHTQLPELSGIHAK